MKSEEILERADKNGFDNFEYDKNLRESCSWSIDYDETSFSLAELATNRSFLEALNKAERDSLQNQLIADLTENNGKDFWKICSEFIDKDGE